MEDDASMILSRGLPFATFDRHVLVTRGENSRNFRLTLLENGRHRGHVVGQHLVLRDGILLRRWHRVPHLAHDPCGPFVISCSNGQVDFLRSHSPYHELGKSFRRMTFASAADLSM